MTITHCDQLRRRLANVRPDRPDRALHGPDDPDHLAAWLSDGYEPDDMAPKLSTRLFETADKAHIAVLEDYIDSFVDEYHPELDVDVVDADIQGSLLAELRREAHRARIIRELEKEETT